MLPKKNRLNRIEIQNIKKSRGKIVQNKYFGIKAFKKGTSTPPRFLIITSKKIDKRAVVRNKTRRRIYHTLKTLLDRIEKGTQITIFLKKPSTSATVSQLKVSLDQALRELSIISNKPTIKKL